MNGYYDAYDDVALEDIEDDELLEFFDDIGERSPFRVIGRSFRPAPRGARAGGYNQPRPAGQYVTQTQLQAVATRIGNDIKKLNEADKTLNTRINATNARLDRHAAAIKKEREARKKADAELKNTMLLSSLVPLIIRPKSVTLATGEKVLVEETDFLKTILPIALVLLGGQLGSLLGGLGSGGSSSGGVL